MIPPSTVRLAANRVVGVAAQHVERYAVVAGIADEAPLGATSPPRPLTSGPGDGG
jgi:hypothetical protein